MTTGAPIYLVSACESGEEFVAAFRRYADRNGLFVPIAEPIPAGRRGRFAVTLKTGGVMIEGEAEVVSAARTPSVLHGRIGMTLRFVDPDPQSKTVLVELEKARLAMKPPPPSVPPRPADVPAEPRPVPPAPAGRIDANNALAECVAIGDLDTLEAAATPPAKPGPRFVVPTIPVVAGAQRSNSPSTPPFGATSPPVARKVTATQPSAVVPPPAPGPTPPVIAPDARAVPPSSSSSPARDDATMPLPIRIDAKSRRDDETIRTPATGTGVARPPTGPQPPATPPRRPTTNSPPLSQRATPAGAVPAVPPPLPRTPTPAGAVPVATAPRPAPSGAVPAVAAPRSTPSGAVPAVAAPRSTPSGAVPAVPSPPIVAAVPPVVPEIEISGEPTDLSEIPTVQEDALPPASEPSADDGWDVSPEPPKDPVLQTLRGKPPVEDLLTTRRDPPSKQAELAAAAREVLQARAAREQRGTRKTSLGVAVVPVGAGVLPGMSPAAVAKGTDEGSRDTALMEAQPGDVDAAGDVDVLAPTLLPNTRPPNIEESTPSGDWTMTPGADGPTIMPRAADKPAAPPRSPSGDWTIARVDDAPDGWSEPSAVGKPALPPAPAPTPGKAEHARAPTPQPGPPVSTVASAAPLESDPKKPDPEDASSSEPKVQIDPTLIEPLQPMPNLDDPSTSAAAYGPPGAPLPPPPNGSVPMHAGAMHAPAPGQVPGQMAGSMAGPMHGPMPGSYPTPIPGGLPPPMMNPAHAMEPQRMGFPPPMFDRSGHAYGGIPHHAEPLPTVAISTPAKRTRMIVIAASAGLVVLLGIVLLATSGGDNPKGTTKGSGTADRPSTAPLPDAGVKIVVKQAADAGAEVAPPPAVDAAAAPTDCLVEVTSAPIGAEIFLDKTTALGTTPTQLKLPCGVEAKLTFRRPRYNNAQRSFTPSEKANRLKVTLRKPTLSVKVSSSPPGATITLGRRRIGVTPTTVRLTAFETSTLVITREGFATVTQKVTPKQNNATVHTTLKRKSRRR